MALLLALAAGVFVVGTEVGEGEDAPGRPPTPARPPALAPPKRIDTVVTVTRDVIGRPIASGFLGVSIEYPALSAYTGENPSAVNPVFEQLLRNLAPGQSPVVRIGGDSTDTAWWPAPRLRRPPGVSFSLTRRWLSLAHALARNIHGKLILGVDLEADRPKVAAAEARALVHGVGTAFVQALEPGNEPLRYRLFPWYVAPHDRLVYARSRHYSYAQYSHDFTRAARVLPRSVELAGPTWGGPAWSSHLASFLRGQPRIAVVTNHAYPLNRCWTRPGRPKYPTVARLLTAYASRRVVRDLGRYAAVAHRLGLEFREDEMQSVACGGKLGVSDTFASALWAVDLLFTLASHGVDGVNLHTFPKAAYRLFSFTRRDGHWVAQVNPEYYGLLMFAAAAPAHARLLRVAKRGASNVRVWSTRATDRTVRLVLINDDVGRGHTVLVRQPLRGAQVTEEVLSASSVYATSGVTYAGQSLEGTATGRLGPQRILRLHRRRGGGYRVTLPAGSAALLTVRPR